MSGYVLIFLALAAAFLLSYLGALWAIRNHDRKKPGW